MAIGDVRPTRHRPPGDQAQCVNASLDDVDMSFGEINKLFNRTIKQINFESMASSIDPEQFCCYTQCCPFSRHIRSKVGGNWASSLLCHV